MRSSRSNCVNGESLTILRPDISVKPSAPVSCGEWSARPYTMPTNITLWNIYYKIVVVLFSVMMKHHGHRYTLGNAIFMKSSQARTEVVWSFQSVLQCVCSSSSSLRRAPYTPVRLAKGGLKPSHPQVHTNLTFMVQPSPFAPLDSVAFWVDMMLKFDSIC